MQTPSQKACHTPPSQEITVLISGNGSNLQALIDAIATKTLPNAHIIRVLSNRKAAYGLQRAEKANIPTTYHNLLPYSKQYPSNDASVKHSPEAREAYDAELANLILGDGPDLVVCAGFMHVLSTKFLDPLIQNGIDIINLHPALPGAFQGAGAIEWAHRAFGRGEIEKTGLMIHYVIAEVDMGKAIVTRDVELREGESLEQLEERFHGIEHEAIVEGTRIALANLEKRGK